MVFAASVYDERQNCKELTLCRRAAQYVNPHAAAAVSKNYGGRLLSWLEVFYISYYLYLCLLWTTSSSAETDNIGHKVNKGYRRKARIYTATDGTYYAATTN